MGASEKLSAQPQSRGSSGRGREERPAPKRRLKYGSSGDAISAGMCPCPDRRRVCKGAEGMGKGLGLTMQVISIEPITWKTWAPSDPGHFSCFACGKEIAQNRVHLRLGGEVDINVCLCPHCTKLSDSSEWLEEFRRKHGK